MVRFGLAFTSWDQSDGVTFQIQAIDPDGTQMRLFERWLDPRRDKDRVWYEESVPAERAQRVTIVLTTAAGSTAYGDHAGWQRLIARASQPPRECIRVRRARPRESRPMLDWMISLMMNVAVIGFGYWGPNLVRNFSHSAKTRVAVVADLSEARLQRCRSMFPSVETTTDAMAAISRPEVDVVAIATPVGSHFELAKAALLAGKHVFVEKPMTQTVEQGEALLDIAAQRSRVIMVDHTFIYTPAVQKIKELVTSGELGDIFYYDSHRVNLGLFQSDVNVLWDLAVHDLAILDYVLGSRPSAVSAIGVSHVAGAPENVAYLTLFMPDSLIAHINVNWLAPVKIRKTLIGGSKKMILFDDLEPSEKLRVYDRGIELRDNLETAYQALVGYRTGDMWAPNLAVTEALQTEVDHFVDCIEGRATPITDGEMGLRMVRILSAATRSIAQRGQPVSLMEA